MRHFLILALLIAAIGCVEPANPCGSCADGNPCTDDSCLEGKCVHRILEGPVQECSGSGGCIEYGCFTGECLPQRIRDCCGNGFCDFNEDFFKCSRDCQPTCFDGIKNQGEEDIDCGGPCKSCQSPKLRYLEKIGFIHGAYTNSTNAYLSSLDRFNRDRNAQALKLSALQSYSEVDLLRTLELNATAPTELRGIGAVLLDSMDSYQSSLHHMVLYLNQGSDSERAAANDAMQKSADLERRFIIEFNRQVASLNTELRNCRNYLLDEGEQAIDCGGVCDKECVAILNVTKYVLVRTEGSGVDLTLNVSSPAIDYPPVQTIIASYFDPAPDKALSNEEGNTQYVYHMNQPGYGVRELRITHTIALQVVNPPVKSKLDIYNPLYLFESELSPLATDICFQSDRLRWLANGTEATERSLLDWMVKNTRYRLNREELGARYMFDNGFGACDEHADLFISLSRCARIPTRRVTGTLYNQTQLNGHAWAEYYDRGWVYVDPSVKNLDQAYVPDNKHVTACVGDGAYHCGVIYTYTYSGAKPKIQVSEQVYLS